MFNVLGPLINPAKPNGMVLGIAEPELGYTFAQSLRDGGVKKALVVCGLEHLDEISCAGPTNVWELSNGQIKEYIIEPEADFGLKCHPLDEVEGKSAASNANDFLNLLDKSRPPLRQEDQPRLQSISDFVLMNASALLVVAGLAEDFKHGVELARRSIDSGKAWEAFQTFRSTSCACK
jgi:anthranilate phosphoribosyltransferase